MAEVIKVEIEQAGEQEQSGREDEVVSVLNCHAYDRLLQVIYLEKENW